MKRYYIDENGKIKNNDNSVCLKLFGICFAVILLGFIGSLSDSKETSTSPKTPEIQQEHTNLSSLKKQCKDEYRDKIANFILDRYNPQLYAIVEEYYKRCEPYAPFDKYSLLHNVYYYSGQDSYKNGELNKALIYYNKALQANLKSRDTVLLDYDYRAIGDCYYIQGEKKTAKEYYKKALSARWTLGTLSVLATTSFELQQFDEATYYATEGLKEIQRLRETNDIEQPYFYENEEKFQKIIKEQK